VTGLVISIIILIYIVGPAWSPLTFVRDSDGDGHADANDIFPNNPNNWTLGKVAISFIIDHDVLINDYVFPFPGNYQVKLDTSNVTDSHSQIHSGTIENSSAYVNCTISFPIGIRNWTEVDYDIMVQASHPPVGHHFVVAMSAMVNVSDGQSRTISPSVYWILF